MTVAGNWREQWCGRRRPFVIGMAKGECLGGLFMFTVGVYVGSPLLIVMGLLAIGVGGGIGILETM